MEKRIMKYKVGDKVRVRENLSIEERYDGCWVVPSMTVFLGKTVTIRKVRENTNRYEIEEDHGTWSWTEEMFEPVESENPADETNVSEEWVLCKDDAESHVDAVGAAESADCLLELKFKEAVRKITLDDLKRILLKKIEDSIKNMSDDVIQDILAEALG